MLSANVLCLKKRKKKSYSVKSDNGRVLVDKPKSFNCLNTSQFLPIFCVARNNAFAFKVLKAIVTLQQELLDNIETDKRFSRLWPEFLHLLIGFAASSLIRRASEWSKTGLRDPTFSRFRDNVAGTEILAIPFMQFTGPSEVTLPTTTHLRSGNSPAFSKMTIRVLVPLNALIPPVATSTFRAPIIIDMFKPQVFVLVDEKIDTV
ncbi:hypothetical protein TcasGA2_TC013027 [Tribolium castaneum]|uniref:Uncharacterized protein n=1 Tax=Tribolium castaneum TaxID=7070 RepID=D6WJP4_TRICA|nr:hypothetical protein TcasGA2_TC013027 [Tribolium castaneum]